MTARVGDLDDGVSFVSIGVLDHSPRHPPVIFSSVCELSVMAMALKGGGQLNVLAAAGLVFAVSTSGARAGEMECAEFPGGEVVCDDGSQMLYRPAGSSQFSRVDDNRRQLVIAYLEVLAAQGGGAGTAGASSSAKPTIIFPDSRSLGSGAIVKDGNCVAVSLPGGGSFMGSGC